MIDFADEIVPGVNLGSLKAFCVLLSCEPEEQEEWAVVSVIERHFIEELPLKRHLYDHLIIDATDEPSTDLFSCFHTASKFINNALSKGKQVLVHCHQGKSRSVSIFCAYIVLTRKLSSDEALAFIRERRTEEICLNSGFREQLKML
jgi:protein-tyrosine phosphatase